MDLQGIIKAVETVESFRLLKGSLHRDEYREKHTEFKKCVSIISDFLDSKFVDTREEFKDIPTTGFLLGATQVNLRVIGAGYFTFTYSEFIEYLKQLYTQNIVYYS